MPVALASTSTLAINMFTFYPKNWFWFPQPFLDKKVFQGSRALVSCTRCSTTKKNTLWYPERSVLTSAEMTHRSDSSYEKRKMHYNDRIYHYSSDGSQVGYSDVPKKAKYFAEIWIEDWDLTYRCPKCAQVSEASVRDYLDDGRCVRFENLA